MASNSGIQEKTADSNFQGSWTTVISAVEQNNVLAIARQGVSFHKTSLNENYIRT